MRITSSTSGSSRTMLMTIIAQTYLDRTVSALPRSLPSVRPRVCKVRRIDRWSLSHMLTAACPTAVRKNRYVILPVDFEEAWKVSWILFHAGISDASGGGQSDTCHGPAPHLKEVERELVLGSIVDILSSSLVCHSKLSRGATRLTNSVRGYPSLLPIMGDRC